MSSAGFDGKFATNSECLASEFEAGQSTGPACVPEKDDWGPYGTVAPREFSSINSSYGFAAYEAPSQDPFNSIDTFSLTTAHTGLNEGSTSLNPLEQQLTFNPLKKEQESTRFTLHAEATAELHLEFPEELMLTPSISQINPLHFSATVASDESGSWVTSPCTQTGGSQSHLSTVHSPLSIEITDQVARDLIEFGGESFDGIVVGSDGGENKNWRQKALPSSLLTISCPFADCPRMFAKTSNLRAHVRLHTGEKPVSMGVPFLVASLLFESEGIHWFSITDTSFLFSFPLSPVLSMVVLFLDVLSGSCGCLH